MQSESKNLQAGCISLVTPLSGIFLGINTCAVHIYNFTMKYTWSSYFFATLPPLPLLPLVKTVPGTVNPASHVSHFNQGTFQLPVVRKKLTNSPVSMDRLPDSKIH